MPSVAFNLGVNYTLYIHRVLETNFVGADTYYVLCVALEPEMDTTSPPPRPPRMFMFNRFLWPYRIYKF